MVVSQKISEISNFWGVDSVDPVIVDISSSLFLPTFSVFATVPASFTTEGADCLFVISVFRTLGGTFRPVFPLFFVHGVFFLIFPPLCVATVRGTVLIVRGLLLRTWPALSISSLSLVRHSYVLDTRVGVGFVVGFTLGCRRVGFVIVTRVTATVGMGSVSDVLLVIGAVSSSNASWENMVERRSRVTFVGDGFLVGRARG